MSTIQTSERRVKCGCSVPKTMVALKFQPKHNLWWKDLVLSWYRNTNQFPKLIICRSVVSIWQCTWSRNFSSLWLAPSFSNIFCYVNYYVIGADASLGRWPVSCNVLMISSHQNLLFLFYWSVSFIDSKVDWDFDFFFWRMLHLGKIFHPGEKVEIEIGLI